MMWRSSHRIAVAATAPFGSRGYARKGSVRAAAREAARGSGAAAREAGPAGDRIAAAASAARSSRTAHGQGRPGQFVFKMQGVGRVVDGDRVLFADVNLAFNAGAKIGILGINGSGKSSFMRIIAGLDEEYDGVAETVGDLSVGYLPQEPALDDDLDVKENVLQDLPEERRELLMELHALRRERIAADAPDAESDAELDAEPDAAGERELALLAQLKELGMEDVDRRVNQSMEALGCPPWDSPVATLSGGERRRVALCRLLISQPDILLLDEPTNHLDASSISWLEHYLHKFPGMVIAVTHDRYFLDNVAGWILEFDRGRLLPFRGNYSEWLEAKAKRLEAEERQHAALSKKLREELAWIQASPKARHSKSRARITRFHELQDSVESRRAYESGSVIIPPGPRLGDQVIEMRGVSKRFDGRALFENLCFRVPPGGVVGIVGPNGSGKSTVLRMISGDLTPDAGEVQIGRSVKLGYVLQGRDALDPDETVYQAISEGLEELVFPSGQYLTMRNYVSAFHFHGQAQQRLVSRLSGGERNRAYLARVIKNGYNVLLLDEPTNDLDVEVLRSLETALDSYPGSAVIVSHDRWFLDRVCTHILAFEPKLGPLFYEGNYQEYIMWRNSVHGDQGESLAKIRRRKLGF
jgi:sulfate-transporting ATPase